MTPSRSCCSRETEVLRAAARGWHDAAPGLLGHVDACRRCTALRAAADLLRRQWLEDVRVAQVASGAAMWWRLDRRLRAERFRRAQRLTLLMQALLVAAAAGAAAAVLQIASPWLAGSGGFLLEALQGTASMLADWRGSRTAWPTTAAWVVGAWVLLLPLALYLTLADD